jgi:S-formylglutathione hydrolase
VGFYLDATHPAWSTHYKMYTYITAELPSLLASVEGLPLDFARQSICGHSMGGHGAIALYLRTIASCTYKSASAFAPALNPTNARWGIKAFNGYLQGGVKEGEKWDSTCLMWDVPEGTRLNVLIDVVSPRILWRPSV